jgi:phosphatidylinositol-3-phosphatase
MAPLTRMARWRSPSLDRLCSRIADFDARTELPVPSAWAIAVAVLGLLAFGVVVGRLVSPAQQDVTTLLADSPRTAAAATSGIAPGAKPPPIGAEATPEGGAAAEPEESLLAQQGTQAAKAPASKGGKSSKVEGAGGGKGGSAPAATPLPATALPPVKHVFLIVLSDEGSGAAFGAGSGAAYLAKTLRRQGELLSNYYAVAGGELANEIALISGQGPTPQTAEDCPQYLDLAPGTIAAEGQAQGSGCVFPAAAQTLADQLEAKRLTWRAYVEGVGDRATSQPPSCRHSQAGAADPYHAPSATDGYVTWRNPFVYFHSLTDGQACAADDVGLDRLAPDLQSPGTTPSLAYIAPDRCEDGSPEPCAPGSASGLAPADAFLRKVVPEIESSPGYKEGGLIAITFDQAPQSGPQADTSGCCVDGPFPNLTAAPASGPGSGAGNSGQTTASAETAGGGKVGLLLISRYVKPGSLNAIGDYNHFSLLRSIEDLFGLEPLGYAAASGLLAFDESVYNGKPA